jgi:hypothetical protein
VRRWVFTLLAVAVPLSCAGRSDDREDGSGGRATAGRGGATGGSSTGGSGGTSGGSGATGGSGGNAGSAMTGGSGGTSGGSGGTSGGSGGASGGKAGAGGSGIGGTAVCCNAIPTCGFAEREVQSAEACRLIPTCREVSLCCTTIYCEALRPGSGGSSGAAGSGGAAGSEGACDPEAEPDRDYVGKSREACSVIRFACPENTVSFQNDCGCGCEQDESCPDFVDCMPGSDPKPGCSAEERELCPYTVIAS